MDIKDFISNFRNHPVFFVGAGFSLRYLTNSYTWDNLLRHISFEMTGEKEHYLDLKANHYRNSSYAFDEIATDLEKEFNSYLQSPGQRNGKFKEINDCFYANMEKGINISRLKIYISKLFKDFLIKEEKQEELIALKKARKNIGSIITTNYDEFIESFFDFKPLIGNNILLSNPYGSVYKIHGCVTEPQKIIITSEDYSAFSNKYELIRAQLLSLFIHNPIVFLGYNIGDSNIKDLLKTIFTYVDPNTPEADKIRANFLLIEYEEGSTNTEVTEHDIVLEDIATIRINKLKTDDFTSVYETIGDLQLPVSAMDIRKVQNIVKEIYAGGDIKVSITEDLDKLDNKDKVLVIGSNNTVKYEYQTTKEMMVNYFSIIEEENSRLIELINKQRIQTSQFFPIFAFSKISPNIEKLEEIKKIQTDKLQGITRVITSHTTIADIVKDDTISKTNKHYAILTALLNNQLDLAEVENHLKEFDAKLSTEYRRLLCAFDYMKYGA